ncbi:response regulator [Spirosoma utsteinense]|uniref:CheY-like chemotaxis protein n=1 Tax=Spirosoma utsteinense TaxID=2585773 RepID=A0ABR6WFJ3_9BACT|nr:response regulator [Spirosoma utsteinense]MBC3789392.1 CheY-like chemotaxis protein [Spirosoma utsteinense]MBC3795320.1 CheY-like chemotaxis protein [Spirosoma utsteinense]
MNNDGPVMVIEDDPDDQYLLLEVFKKLGYTNEVLYFFDGQEALDYLKATNITPFLILSDVNMPRLDGFGLRDQIRIDAGLQLRCIPYLLFSTAVNQQMVINAYSLSAQGFFIKQNTMAELEETISIIMEYWRRCAAPNKF